VDARGSYPANVVSGVTSRKAFYLYATLRPQRSRWSHSGFDAL